jgi:hypothetical protein
VNEKEELVKRRMRKKHVDGGKKERKKGRKRGIRLAELEDEE